jgi:hypothetical protein
MKKAVIFKKEKTPLPVSVIRRREAVNYGSKLLKYFSRNN